MSFLLRLTTLLIGLPCLAMAQSAPDPQSVPDPLTCLLTPVRSSAIGSDRGGIVREIAVARADYVEPGDILLQLDDALAQSDLRLTEINLRAIMGRLERAERLTASNVVARDEIEAIRTELALAEAEADRAALQLQRATITAPFAGFVAQVLVSEGELIGPEPLLRLIDMSTLRAELVFAAEAWGRVAKGDVLTIAVDLTGGRVPAMVTAIDPYVDPASNTFSVLAEIDNADLTLPSGASCRWAR